MGKAKYFLSYIPPLSTLYICTKSEDFGAGTFIQHGFSSIIAAEKIGENCWINQQVTNVRISAGAKVCGKVTIGEKTTIGVNAVVVKDVLPGSVVIPSPMMLIQEEGEKVYKKL